MSSNKTGTKTKPWNVDTASAPPDERVYTDFKDKARTCPTNMKFKTINERIKLWVKALEEIYPDVKLWDYKQKTKQKLVSLKIRDTDNGNLILKFHLSTGVVVIQGSQPISYHSKAVIDTTLPME